MCQACYSSELKSDKDALAARVHPAKLGYSPMFGAILGAIIGHDYGITPHIASISITSDGFVLGNGSRHLLGTAADLERNLANFYTDISADDANVITKLYSNVLDYRPKESKRG